MRPAIFAFTLFFTVNCAGCAQRSFEEAFAAGGIEWQPVSNVEVKRKSGNTTKIEAVNFTTKLTYDSAGRPSADTTGQKTYQWTGKEATFGPGAIIRISKTAKVREGTINSGAEWTWDGAKWMPKG